MPKSPTQDIAAGLHVKTVDLLDTGSLFDTLPHSYIVFKANDPDFTILAENKAHKTVAMTTHKSVLGMPVLEAFPDTSPKYKKTGVSDLIESLRKVMSTGQPDPMEALRYDLKAPDGKLEKRYWRVTHYPLFDSSDKIHAICQSTVDITDEIRTGRKLDEAQRQLDEALSVGLIGTWLWDLSEDYVVADKNLLHMFGIQPEEAINGLPLPTFTNSIYIDDRPRVQAAINETVATQSAFEQEYRTVTRAGDIRWVIARGRIETDADGKAVRFPGVIVDITERKLAEQNMLFLSQVSRALSSSLDYNLTLKSIADLAVPGLADWCSIDILEAGAIRQVAIAHKDPKKVTWAKKLRQSRPMKLDDPTGVPAVLRSGEPEYYPEITEAMLAASSSSPEQLELARSLNLTSIMIVPLTIQGAHIGAITLVSCELKRHYNRDDLQMARELANRASLAISNAQLYKTAQDEIAVRTKLEEQLRDANDALEARVVKRTEELQETNRDLERSNQELQDFAYVASHDLQEPLRKIQAFGNLLEDEFGTVLADNDGDGKDYLDRMRSAASRMSTLIEDLLAFSRVTTKANPIDEVDLTTVAHEVAGDLEVRIKESDATVTINELPTIRADAMQMRQLLQNLIGNALKFARPNVPPNVTVTAVAVQPEGATMKYWQLTVADNGIGFDEKYIDKIFAVFQRLHGKEAYQGTGIGLAICRKIAERHDGTITATSQLGVGSTFIVTLPAGRRSITSSTKQSRKA